MDSGTQPGTAEACSHLSCRPDDKGARQGKSNPFVGIEKLKKKKHDRTVSAGELALGVELGRRMGGGHSTSVRLHCSRPACACVGPSKCAH
jgi:hypothetical protein